MRDQWWVTQREKALDRRDYDTANAIGRIVWAMVSGDIPSDTRRQIEELDDLETRRLIQDVKEVIRVASERDAGSEYRTVVAYLKDRFPPRWWNALQAGGR